LSELKTTGGKLFAGCYALFSGVAFLTIVGVLPRQSRIACCTSFTSKRTGSRATADAPGPCASISSASLRWTASRHSGETVGRTSRLQARGKDVSDHSIDGEIIETIGFKCSAADFRQLTDLDGIIPAPYLARASWVQLEDPAALPAAQLQAQVRASYELVKAKLPKRIQAQLF